MSQSIDTEHPDSTEQYRVLVVRRFEARLSRTDGWRMASPSSMHVLHVVRGDAAVLAEGQTADPGRWRIRRWLVNVSGVRAALNERRGACGGRDPGAGPAGDGATSQPPRPGALAIRPLAIPACSTLRVSCDLPGSEPARVEVYDAGGRLVNRREVAVPAPGVVTIEAGAVAQLLPGIYWVRLAQAARRPCTSMVIVAPSVALSTMILHHPGISLLGGFSSVLGRLGQADLCRHLLFAKRAVILGVVLLGYAFHRWIGESHTHPS